MEIGRFKANKKRLIAWVVIPPLLTVSVGLSTYAFQQRELWRLQQAESLTEVLPSIIQIRDEAAALLKNFNESSPEEIVSENQLISFLQDIAQQQNFLVNTIQVDRLAPAAGGKFPRLNAVVQGSGSFSAIQLYINKAESVNQMLSASSINLSQSRDGGDEYFGAKITFDLLLINEVLSSTGGAR